MAGVQKPEVTVADILKRAEELKIDPNNIKHMQDMVQFDTKLGALGNMPKDLQSAIFNSGVGEKGFLDLLQKGGINLDLDALKKQFTNSPTWSKALGGLGELKEGGMKALGAIGGAVSDGAARLGRLVQSVGFSDGKEKESTTTATAPAASAPVTPPSAAAPAAPAVLDSSGHDMAYSDDQWASAAVHGTVAVAKAKARLRTQSLR